MAPAITTGTVTCPSPRGTTSLDSSQFPLHPDSSLLPTPYLQILPCGFPWAKSCNCSLMASVANSWLPSKWLGAGARPWGLLIGWHQVGKSRENDAVFGPQPRLHPGVPPQAASSRRLGQFLSFAHCGQTVPWSWALLPWAGAVQLNRKNQGQFLLLGVPWPLTQAPHFQWVHRLQPPVPGPQ